MGMTFILEQKDKDFETISFLKTFHDLVPRVCTYKSEVPQGGPMRPKKNSFGFQNLECSFGFDRWDKGLMRQ